MDAFTYFRTSDSGKPVIDELLRVTPWMIGESIAQNARLAAGRMHERHCSLHKLPGDSFVTTIMRVFCRHTSLCIFETYFDNVVLPDIPFLTFSWTTERAIALHTSVRTRQIEIGRLSGFPHLKESLLRLEDEFSEVGHRFSWELAAAA